MVNEVKRPLTASGFELTAGESLAIDRRRRRTASGRHLNQTERADQLRVAVDVYRAWEADQTTKEGKRQAKLTSLEDYEKCFLLRRRSGKLQRELAQEVGCSRLWLNKMETGQAGCDDLVAYWKRVGGFN